MARLEAGSGPAPATGGARVRPRTRGAAIIEHLTLERADTRLAFVVALVALSLGTPFISVAAGLPAIRLDQALLLLSVPAVLRLAIRHPEFRRVGLVDAAFLLLALSTLATVVLAPMLIPGVTRSFRDVFEILRIVQYWIVFRLGSTIVPTGLGSLRVGQVLAVGAIGLGVASVLQYLNPPGFNETITAIWTQAHNLLGVVREGRAVGTAGNANQFGIFAVLLVFVALAGRAVARRGDPAWLWTLAITAASVAVVLAQSRGAILGLAVGLAAAAALLLVRRSLTHALVVALPSVVAAAVILVPLIVVTPPSSGSITNRFRLSGLSVDPSVVVRIGRIEALVNGGSAGDANTPPNGQACADDRPGPIGPAAGHEPGEDAPAAASTRVTSAVAAAVVDFACKYGAWPANLASDLAPEFTRVSPVTPEGSLRLYSSGRGFAVGLRSSIESPDEQPGAGSLPNLLVNPSFEGTDGLAAWRGTPGATITSAVGGSAFGMGAGQAEIPANGAIYQLIVADLPPETEYTAGIWVRSGGEPTGLQLYVTVVTARGDSIDPLAVRAVTTGGDSWEHLALAFTTPPTRLSSLTVMLRAPGAPARVLVDGASLTEGPFAIPFGQLSDAPPSSVSSGPAFSDSPILGIGPQKSEGVAVFDNEYASFLAHYGALGLLSYMLLFVSALAVGIRTALRVSDWGGHLGVALVATTLALGVFAVPAGAFRQVQVMVVYWLLVGLAFALSTSRPGASGPATTDVA